MQSPLEFNAIGKSHVSIVRVSIEKLASRSGSDCGSTTFLFGLFLSLLPLFFRGLFFLLRGGFEILDLALQNSPVRAAHAEILRGRKIKELSSQSVDNGVSEKFSNID